jgi:DNA-binding MarR family transcriptional regulator
MSQASLGRSDWQAQTFAPHKLPGHFGYLVHDLARVRGTFFDRLFKPLGLTRTQVVLMGTLANFEYLLNQQELSIAMDLSKVTIGAMLDVLERNGFVKRGIGKKDRREKLIRVTPEGLAALDRARDIAREADKAILAGLDGEDVKVTEKILRQANAIIRKMMRDSSV